MILHGIVSKQRPTGPDNSRREIVFFTDETLALWSPLRDEACPLPWEEAQRVARQCGGDAEVLSAEQRAHLHRQRQPALPGLGYIDP